MTKHFLYHYEWLAHEQIMSSIQDKVFSFDATGQHNITRDEVFEDVPAIRKPYFIENINIQLQIVGSGGILYDIYIKDSSNGALYPYYGLTDLSNDKQNFTLNLERTSNIIEIMFDIKTLDSDTELKVIFKNITNF